MSDMQDGDTLPKLNSAMFREAGKIGLTRKQQDVSSNADIKTWCNTLDFYLELNGMTSILFKDEEGGYHVTWHKENK